jgi:uncharacterized protein (DUF2336 family)
MVDFMGVGEFLLWLERASVTERCDAAELIARSFFSPMTLDERCTAEASLAVLLDDTSPLVRKVLAETLSLTRSAPRQAVHALALDQLDIAAPLLIRSAIEDATLIEAVTRDGHEAAIFIADRANVSARVASSIAEHGSLEACVVLLANQTARTDIAALGRIIDRHASAPELRGLLASDQRLNLTMRQQLVDAAAHDICRSPLVAKLFGETRARDLEQDSTFGAMLDLVEHARIDALPSYVANLRDAGRINAALIMKALVWGRIDFVATIICDLGGRNESQVRSVLVRGGSRALEALMDDIGFGGLIRQLAVNALMLWRDIASGAVQFGRQEVAWQLLRAAEAGAGQAANDDLTAMLRKIYLEISRENARSLANDAREQARLEEMAATIALAALEDDFTGLEIDGDVQLDSNISLVAEVSGSSSEATVTLDAPTLSDVVLEQQANSGDDSEDDLFAVIQSGDAAYKRRLEKYAMAA